MSAWLLGGFVLLTLSTAGAQFERRRHRSRQRWIAWKREAEPAVGAAMLAHDLLADDAQDITDVERWQSITDRVRQAAQDLDIVASNGPTIDATIVTRETAEALRSVVVALDTERLLAVSDQPLKPEEVAAIKGATRSRRYGLEVRLARLKQFV